MANEQEIELRQELSGIASAAMVKIIDQPSYDHATSLLMEQIIPFRKRWADYWAPLKKAAYDAHKSVMAKFNEGDEPAEKAERTIKAEIRRWVEEQERIRHEAQRKAQEAAEAAERERLLVQAVAAEASGATAEEVEQIMATPVVAVAEPVAETYERAAGVSTRDNWKARVTDIKKLCLAVSKGLVPPNYVLPNETVLNARARADRETLALPGVIAVNDRVISGRPK